MVRPESYFDDYIKNFSTNMYFLKNGTKQCNTWPIKPNQGKQYFEEMKSWFTNEGPIRATYVGVHSPMYSESKFHKFEARDVTIKKSKVMTFYFTLDDLNLRYYEEDSIINVTPGWKERVFDQDSFDDFMTCKKTTHHGHNAASFLN